MMKLEQIQNNGENVESKFWKYQIAEFKNITS